MASDWSGLTGADLPDGSPIYESAVGAYQVTLWPDVLRIRKRNDDYLFFLRHIVAVQLLNDLVKVYGAGVAYEFATADGPAMRQAIVAAVRKLPVG